jgi:hypothetical protein
LAKATQVRHILGAAAHAARAFELSAENDSSAGGDCLAHCQMLADATVIEVLRRYPPAPRGSGRVGELMRELDGSLR